MEALIIIDVQNDYFTNGNMELINSDKALENIKKVIEKFRKSNKEIIYIKHISSQEGATFFLPNTNGAEIHEKITPLEYEKVIIKQYPNSFKETELQDYLIKKKIDKLIITGMMTQMCVDSTVRAAKDFGYECVVLSDACATKDFVYNNQIVKAENIQAAFFVGLSYYYAKILSTEIYIKTHE